LLSLGVLWGQGNWLFWVSYFMLYLVDSCNSLNHLRFGLCLFWSCVVRMSSAYLKYSLILISY
jgi:hypothetical protein